MPKWANAAVLENGPQHIKTLAGTNTITERIVAAYAAGDSHATVVANTVASVALAAGDMVWSDGAGSSRVLTIAEKADVAISADSGADPDLHLVVTDDTTSTVLWVTDETSDQVLTSGGSKDIPAWMITVPQPV